MFGVGAIVATGNLNIKPVLLQAAAGAVAGDGISYWLSRHYQGELQRIWLFSHYPGMLQKEMDFFHRHGGKSVLFGRIVSPIRPIIPVVAGMLDLRLYSAGSLFLVLTVFMAGWGFLGVLQDVLAKDPLVMAD